MAEIRVTVDFAPQPGAVVRFTLPNDLGVYYGSVVDIVELGERIGLRVEAPKMPQHLADLYIRDEWLDDMILREHALSAD